MKKTNKTAVTISAFMIVFLFLFSCDNSNDSSDDKPFSHDPINEDFDEADKPSYETITYDDNGTSHSYELMLPWNYDKDHNADRSYPLMINVHYSGSLIAGDTQRMQDYPSFCLDAASDSDWFYAMVAELVANYRIDTDRIYLAGFSAGGSGSYPFASNLEAKQGLTVAGIVRCAGGSNSELSAAIADKTSVWYHVGLSDSYDFGYGNGLLSEDPNDERRISNKAYAYVKGLDSNAKADETVETKTVSGYECTTTSLSLAGVEIFKRSHYAEMGHSAPAYSDPDVVEWLFNQHLSNRD
jgi:predicted peptidase